MTVFDLTCGLVLAVSTLVGFTNGAVREVVGFFAFGLAVALAALLLPLTGPLARASIHPALVANAAAVVTVFVAAYIALKLVAHWLTMRLRDRGGLGTVNRVGGAGVGVVRALVLMGVFYLLYNAVTPQSLRPHWIEGAALLPAARASGHALQAFAPKGLNAAGHLGGGLKDAVSAGASDNAAESAPTLDQTPPADTPPAPIHRRHGYAPQSRRGMDVLVERSR